MMEGCEGGSARQDTEREILLSVLSSNTSLLWRNFWNEGFQDERNSVLFGWVDDVFIMQIIKMQDISQNTSPISSHLKIPPAHSYHFCL